MHKSNRLILGVALASFIFLGCFVALVIDTFTRMPDFSKLKSQVKVRFKMPGDREVERMVGPAVPGWVPIGHVSNPVLMAIVASEDASFFSHEGVDYHELREAIKKDLQERRFARGASTITQQLVKNVYLDRSKTLWRKVREFLWARELDKVLTKTQILNFYVNIVEFGPGIYGIREAAWHYFQTDPSELSAKKAAFLAMMLPAPTKYYTYFKTKKVTHWAVKRMRQILTVMYKMHFIEEGTYQVALLEPLWSNEIVEGGWGGKGTGVEESVPSEDNELPKVGDSPFGDFERKTPRVRQSGLPNPEQIPSQEPSDQEKLDREKSDREMTIDPVVIPEEQTDPVPVD